MGNWRKRELKKAKWKQLLNAWPICLLILSTQSIKKYITPYMQKRFQDYIVPTICPWVSEDAWLRETVEHISPRYAFRLLSGA